MKIRPPPADDLVVVQNSTTERSDSDSAAGPATPSAGTPESAEQLLRALAVSESRLAVAVQQNGALRREQSRLRQEVARLGGKNKQAHLLRFARIH